MDVTAVRGSQLTYCVEVAAELIADVEEQTVRSVHQAQRPGRESPDARWPRSAQGVMPLKVIAVLMPFGTAYLIKNKSTASGGETPKGSAVSGVYRPHRDLWHTEGTLLSRSSWSRGDLVSAVGLGEDAIHRCIP